MKKLVILLAVSLLVGGMAMAQTLHTGPVGVDFNNHGSVTGNQTVTLDIPERVAIYIAEDTISHDIDTWIGSGWGINDFRPNGCGVVRTGQASGVTSLLDLYLAVADNPAADSYPAFVYNSSGDFLSGLVACFDTTQVQLFSNGARGIDFRAAFDVPAGLGKFGIEVSNNLLTVDPREIVTGGPDGAFRALVGAGPQNWRLAVTRNAYSGDRQTGPFNGRSGGTYTTQGWAPANVMHAFYLDGTETSGAKSMTITYTLIGAF